MYALEWVVLPYSICLSLCQLLETHSYLRLSSEDSKKICALRHLHTMLIPSTPVVGAGTGGADGLQATEAITGSVRISSVSVLVI